MNQNEQKLLDALKQIRAIANDVLASTSEPAPTVPVPKKPDPFEHLSPHLRQHFEEDR